MYTKEEKQKILGILWRSFTFDTRLEKYRTEPFRVLAEKCGVSKSIISSIGTILEYEGILSLCRGSGTYVDKYQYEILKIYLKEHRVKETFSDDEMLVYQSCIDVIKQSIKSKDISSNVSETIKTLEKMGMISKYEKHFITIITDALQKHEITKYTYLEYMERIFID